MPLQMLADFGPDDIILDYVITERAVLALDHWTDFYRNAIESMRPGLSGILLSRESTVRFFRRLQPVPYCAEPGQQLNCVCGARRPTRHAKIRGVSYARPSGSREPHR